MNESPGGGSEAAALRQAFDLSFALPPPPPTPEVEDLLTIRLAADVYVIRLRDIAGMIAGRRVVPVPSATPDLLGLAGIRGGVFSSSSTKPFAAMCTSSTGIQRRCFRFRVSWDLALPDTMSRPRSLLRQH